MNIREAHEKFATDEQCLQYIQKMRWPGTIFRDTHLPLIVWFQAITLMLNAKKGISAKKLQRDLGIGGYKTAWCLNHRTHEVMQEGSIRKLGRIVEIDETYVVGKQRGEA